ncbi:hypothetical protein DMENIID0001_080450 [Sergentomyia squamirostris]
MATRERKAKLSAESPTPSAGSDSAPSTPTSNATGGGGKSGRKSAASGATTPAAVGRVRSTRGSSAQQVADEGEHEKEKEKTEEADGEVKTPRTPRISRASAKAAEETKTDVKENEEKPKKDPEEVKKKDTEVEEKVEKLENGEKEEKTEIVDKKNVSPAPKSPRKSTSPKTKRKVNRRTLTREAVMKRRSLPVTSGRSRASTMVTRRNSSAKIEAITKALKEETLPVRKSTRNRRKTKIIDMEPIKKKRTRMLSQGEEKASSQENPSKDDVEMKEPEKVAKSEAVSDSELIRRRSGSVSKYSDTTDNSSFYDAVAFKEPEEWGRDSNATPKADAEGEEVKSEAVEMEEDSTTESNKTEEAKGDDNESTSGRKSRSSSLLRRSGRPKKRQKKEPEAETASVAATKVAKVAENKTEGSNSVIPPFEEATEDGDGDKSAKGAPLHVETLAKESPAVDEDPKDEEDVEEKKSKAASLSPELVSEGVSPISVQQFYGQPAFLENNLGIEEDPKLREIVQVKEIIKQADKEEKPEEKVEEEPKAVEDEIKQEVTEVKEVVNGTIKAESVPEESAETKEEKNKKDEEEKKDEVEEVKQSESEEPAQSNEKPPESPEDTKENVPDKENVMSNGETQEENAEKVTNIDDDGSKSPVLETPEARLMKESHFKSLGLLTHEAAVEAKIEKARRREFFKSAAQKSSLSSASSTSSTGSVSSQNGTKNGKRSRESGATKEIVSGQEYTGTLKTVIKLHRPQSQEKRKTRMPLKMTFQKGRGKSAQANNDRDQLNLSNSDEDTYYTIQNETDTPNQETSHGGNNRKSHNRSHTGETSASASVTAEPLKEVEKALVIPEKASSFSIHPGRLCQDQCFYCGGKFGLFDTPCHVAQIKSLERQKKILDNEEKLTVDSCLCDACYRHVDRRANCPSYRNRQSNRLAGLNKDEGADRIQQDVEEGRATSLCLVTGCGEMSSHLLRRKWFSKMRKQINRLIRLNVDVSNAHGLGQVPICDTHYDIISHLMVCFLCKRKVPRNHIYYINQDTKRLEQLIRKQGIPVVLGAIGVVCKLCRYYAKLLLKPPNDRKSQQAQFVRSYRRRLLSFHNVELLDASDEKEDDRRSQPEERGNAVAPRRGRRAAGGKQDEDQDISDANDTSQNTSSGQIVLENDVMVDYDVPVLDSGSGQKNKQQKMQSLLIPRNQQRTPQIPKDSEISRILRANPNISMRELFPGEDEMGLQVYLPFGQTGQRTPEGWTRATSILQYDEPTRQLWEELQKPYGNQSSFIRHLVLLEKYFRNGDLILSPSASSSAVTYSESVQNRLKSFDNVPSENLSIFQQLSHAPITITPANPRPRTSTGRQSDGGASTSLLKSNNTHREGSEGGVSIIRKPSSGTIPPDLISITTTPSKNTGNVDTITVTATGGSKESSPPAPETPTASTSSAPTNCKDVIVKLPESLSPAERRLVNGKAWRPTLMPIAPLETTSRDGINTLYQTADGRLLPSRVQVMSGGKPYHISIYDYNRMCILRREKILQKAMANQQGKSSPENGKSDKSPTSQAQPQASTSKGKVQIPNKILEQNSVHPIAHKQSPSTELQSLIKVRKPNPTSLLKNQIPIAPKPPVQVQVPTIVSLGTPNTIQNANPMMSIIDLMKTTTAPTAATSMWLLNEPLNGPQALVADNAAAASLLSKIPKSLTVIPQQKGRSGSRVSSGEDQSSA